MHRGGFSHHRSHHSHGGARHAFMFMAFLLPQSGVHRKKHKLTQKEFWFGFSVVAACILFSLIVH